MVTVDAAMIATFVDVVFSYCDGLIPVRAFADKGHAESGPPKTIWIVNDGTAAAKLAAFATSAAQTGIAIYVVPGTVAAEGQARAADVRQMQTVLVDLDTGEIPRKLAHLIQHLGQPTLVVQSGGRTVEGADKIHVWWRLNEPAEGADLDALCRLRGVIADKVGGDTHFRSAHQPIRVAGTVHQKTGHRRLATILQHQPGADVDLADFAEAVDAMPILPGSGFQPLHDPVRPGVDIVMTTPVREAARMRGRGSKVPVRRSATLSVRSMTVALRGRTRGRQSANTMLRCCDHLGQSSDSGTRSGA